MRFLLISVVLWGSIGYVGMLSAADAPDVAKPSLLIERQNCWILPSPDGTTAAVSARDVPAYLIDVESDTVRAPLERSEELSQYSTDVFSSDGSKVAGICEDFQGKDHIVVWQVATGRLLQRAPLPDTAVYVMSLRFSRRGDVIYVGGRNDLFEYQLATNSLTSLVDDVSYYIMDIADHPHEDHVAFIDGQHRFGLREWFQVEQAVRRVPPWGGQTPDENLRGLKSVDYSADGSQLVVCGFVQELEEPPQSYSIIIRFDGQTRREVSRVVTPQHVTRVRYVGGTKTLLLWGKTREAGGGFGFIGPKSSRVDAWQHVNAFIPGDEYGPAITEAIVQPGKNGHVTVGAGPWLLKWRRDGWSQKWSSLFPE